MSDQLLAEIKRLELEVARLGAVKKMLDTPRYPLYLTGDELREIVGWLNNGNNTATELATDIAGTMQAMGVNPQCAVIGCQNEATREWGGRPHCASCMPRLKLS